MYELKGEPGKKFCLSILISLGYLLYTQVTITISSTYWREMEKEGRKWWATFVQKQPKLPSITSEFLGYTISLLHFIKQIIFFLNLTDSLKSTGEYLSQKLERQKRFFGFFSFFQFILSTLKSNSLQLLVTFSKKLTTLVTELPHDKSNQLPVKITITLLF